MHPSEISFFDADYAVLHRFLFIFLEGYKPIADIKMTISEIKSGLKTQFIGQDIQIYQQIDSTNEEAIKQSGNNPPEGTLILAEYQTAGKGKYGKCWVAPTQSSILGSIILYPKLDSRQQGFITLIMALSIARTIFNITGLEAKIKWPNDVMIEGKKVSGILTEKGQRNSLVVGFGINVNINYGDMPKSIRKTASSIQIELGCKFSRAELLQSLLVNFEKMYILLNSGKKDELLAQILSLSETVGKYVIVKQGTQIIKGKAFSINKNGGLLIKIENGNIKEIYSGELSILLN